MGQPAGAVAAGCLPAWVVAVKARWYAVVDPKTGGVATVLDMEAKPCMPSPPCGGCESCLAQQAGYSGFELVPVDQGEFETLSDALGRIYA